MPCPYCASRMHTNQTVIEFECGTRTLKDGSQSSVQPNICKRIQTAEAENRDLQNKVKEQGLILGTLMTWAKGNGFEIEIHVLGPEGDKHVRT